MKFEAGEAVFDVSGESEVICTQWSEDYTTVVGQEDCLLLNVYVPGQSVSQSVSQSGKASLTVDC